MSFTHCFSVFIVNFGHVIDSWDAKNLIIDIRKYPLLQLKNLQTNIPLIQKPVNWVARWFLYEGQHWSLKAYQSTLTPEIYRSIAETHYKHFQTSRMERFGCSILYV